MCWQYVECDSKEHAADPTVQQQDELESDRPAFWTITDALQDARLCWNHTEECRARIEQEMVNKGDAIKLETSGNQEEIVPELMSV